MVSVEYLCVCMSFFIYWQLPGLVSVQQLENMTELTNGNLTTLFICNIYSISTDFCVDPGCEVDIASECSAILPDGSQVPCDEIPTDPQDCVEDLALEYCYTIDNIGQSCGSISSIDRTRSRDDPTGEEVSSDTSSLLSRLDISDYCPDDAPIRFCEQETINSCETGCYATDIVMDATMPDGFSCGAADDFQFCHTPGCKIAVDTSCTLDGTDTDCADIPTESAAECSLKDIEYCYTITNVGGSCGEVSTLERTRNPPGSPVGTVTLTSLIESNRAICPPGSFEGPSEIVVCEKEQVSTCESSSSETEVSVEVAMPGDDFVCTAADDYAFSITAGCNIGAQASCTATLPDGSQTPCDAVPTDPDLCVENMPVEYCYVIDNIGESCGALSTLDRTQSKFTFDGVIASDDSDVLALLPDSGRELCPNDPPIRVCELGQINSCQAACYDSDVFIAASMPDGFTCSTEADLSFCQEPGCEVQVETTCVTDNGTDCADLDPTPETCGATNMQYCYTITNVGESCGEVSKLQRNSFPPGGAQGALDLFGFISDTTICPPDRIEGPSEIVVCEDFVSVNTCDDQCYLTTAEAAVTMNDGSSVCNAGDAYEVCINPGCVIETEMECNATLIDGSTVPCDNLPVASVLTCQNEPYTIEYCYDITNVGPTCGNVSRIQRTRTGMVSDILSTLIPNPAERLICPGDTIRKCEFLAVDSCTEACYDTSVAVETTMPDNFVCQAQDEDAFCVPEPFSEDCNVAVSLDCTMPPESTVNGSGECDAIIPIATRCDDRASVMTWRFNGGDCEQSFNIQEADKFMCTDFGPGGAPTEGTAYVNVISAKDQNEVYFDGEVEVGSLFTMYAPAGGKFNADSIFTVYSDSSKTTILQQSNVHTSCSSNLFLKDRFGAVQLLIFQNDVGLFTCFVQATYAFTFTNEGASSQGTITDFISTTNGVAEDCLDDIPDGQQTILPDETYVMPKQVLIDMTVRQDYNTEVAIRAVTPTGSFFCDSGTSLQFTAGNPNLPIFG